MREGEDVNNLKGLLSSFKVRKLRIDILTLFLSLTVLSFSVVISFSYFESRRAILDFSKETIQMASRQVMDRIEFLGFDIEETLHDFSGLFRDPTKFSVDNEDLTFFMLNAIKSNANLAALFIAIPDGRMLLTGDLSLSEQKYYEADRGRPLPKEAAYIVKIQDPKRDPPEEWLYTDREQQVIDRESFSFITFDPRSRPWYQVAMSEEGIVWTGLYSFLVTGEAGITASMVVQDKKTEVPLILGADLSFVLLNKFLDKQVIGKSGRAFLIDDNGKILISGLGGEAEKQAQVRVKAALEEHRTSKVTEFTFISENTKYLAYISSVPANFGKGWRLVIIVPFSDFFSELVATQITIIAITLLVLVIASCITYYFSRRIAGPIVTLVHEVDKLTHLRLKTEKRVQSHIEEITLLDQAVASMRVALRSFLRYVPKDIIRHLLESGKEVVLGGEKQELTIFFSDIQGFTSMSEKYSTDFLMPLLSDYFDGLSKTILRHQGTIDKYIGDSVMAFWGAPKSIPDHCYQACLTTLHCHNFILQFNQKRRELNQPEFITRFGIHTGVVVVGNIGTSERMNYTVIGDAVNATARLQAAAKNYRVPILISEEVQKHIDNDFLTRPLDEIEVKGKEKKIRIYELMATLKEGSLHATQEQTLLAKRFTRAYHLWIQGNSSAAKAIFAEIHKDHPDDFCSKLYLDKCSE